MAQKKILLFLGLFSLSLAAWPVSMESKAGVSATVQAGQLNIHGKVLDSTGEPVIGANVLEKGTANGIITDLDGSFSLTVKQGATVEVSCIGYITRTLEATSSTLNIVLEEDNEILEKVVVVGYGTMKKSDLTGSVSSVKSKDLSYTASSQVETALQGKVTGVSIVVSGDPSESAQVRVRGVASLNNSDPLFVVDGFPVGDIKNIVPQDIESMEVLKDASATAIYGSKGANGVILVTTKKGRSQKNEIGFDMNLGVNTVTNLPELCNATEYAELLLETGKYDGQSSKVTELQKVIDERMIGTKWLEEITRPGFFQKYGLSMRGGSDRNKYFLSGNYSSDSGVLNNTVYKKFTLRFNNSYKISDRLTFDTKLSYMNEHKNWHNLHHEIGTFFKGMIIDPITPVYNEEGNYNRAFYTYTDNCVRLINDARNRNHNEHNFYSAFTLKAEILKGFFFTTDFSAHLVFRNRKEYNAEYFVSNEERLDESSLYELRHSSSDWMYNALLDYSNKINEHSMSFMGGFEMQGSNWSNISAEGFDIPVYDYLWYLSAAKSPEYTVGANQAIVRLLSGFLRANYSYRNRYLLTATFRTDASSRFASHCRTGYFPSASLGWNIKEEEFMEDFSNLNMLKLRLGYGVTGNQNSAGYYDYLALMSNVGVYGINGVPANSVSPNKMVNEDLQWETVEMYNVGADLGLWDNHLQATADYYIKNTKDMILSQPVPLYTGAEAPTVNLGSVQNRGFELGIKVQDYEKPFKWNVGLNLSTVRNKVTSLGRRQHVVDDGFLNKINENITRTEVGSEIAYFHGLKTDGIFRSREEIEAHSKDGILIQPKARIGDLKFVDINNDGVIDNMDKTNLGSAIPALSAGLNLHFEYEGFDLNADFYSELGKKVVNSNVFWLQNVTMGENFNQYRYYYENRYHPQNNPDGTLPAMAPTDDNGNMKFSDIYVEDASFLRLQNLQLGYSLSERAVSRLGIYKMRLYLSGDNLFLLTRYHGTDPELAGFKGKITYAGIDKGQVYPRPRVLSFGINVTL